MTPRDREIERLRAWMDNRKPKARLPHKLTEIVIAGLWGLFLAILGMAAAIESGAI